MSKWTKTEHKAPEEGEWCIVWSDGTLPRLPSIAYFKCCTEDDGVYAGQWQWTDGEFYFPLATHWMPLPEPPS